MPSFRLKPRLPLWRIGAVVAALLLAPLLLDLVTPRLVDDHSPVTLGAAGNPWENVIEWPEGGELVCKKAGDIMMPAWDCDGTMIHAMMVEGSRDEENTLKRAMRSILMVPANEGKFVRDDGVLLFETDEGIAISQEGTGDFEGQTMIAVVTGEKQRPYSAVILHDMRGGDGPLPDLSEIGAKA
ncbi:hypothetical protein [Corynebacterium sp. H130]|uniref:hypothetical protein n=1 Tax=Corynebacterium sp. H130 TaxID=3133444 RepID=UPI0030B5ED05